MAHLIWYDTQTQVSERQIIQIMHRSIIQFYYYLPSYKYTNDDPNTVFMGADKTKNSSIKNGINIEYIHVVDNIPMTYRVEFIEYERQIGCDTMKAIRYF